MKCRVMKARAKGRPVPSRVLPPMPERDADAGLSSRFGLPWDSKYDRLLDAMGVPEPERARVVADLLAILHPALDAYLAETKAAARQCDPPPAP